MDAHHTHDVCDPSRCPLCGAGNECPRAGCDPCRGSCWCQWVEMPEALLAAVPEASRGRACICAACVARFRRSQRWQPIAGADETYRDALGRTVFTERYHLRRGYCCGNECRHCPYDAEGRPRAGSLAAAASAWVPLLLAIVWILTGGSVRARAAEVGSEDFSVDPAGRGWRVSGEADLFRWDPERAALEVTWDSSRPNSYFHRPLPRPVTRQDDFSFGFTLRLESHAVGTSPGLPGTFQIALGLIRVADATAPDFRRGVFLKSRNLVEWTWFGADASISPSVSPVVVPSDGRLPWGYADSYVALEPGVLYGFRLRWSAAEQTLSMDMTVDGETGPDLTPIRLPAGFTEFTVDALAVSSYSDAGQDPRFGGSVRATGWIDDLSWEMPPPPVTGLEYSGNGSDRRVRFDSETGWVYVLEVSTDLREWTPVNGAVAGTGGVLELIDPRRILLSEAFFRVRAERP